MYDCEKCRDKKHILVDGRYVRCDCYQSTLAELNTEHLPPHLKQLSLDSIDTKNEVAVNVCFTILKRLEVGAFPRKFVILSGGDPIDRGRIVAAFISTSARDGFSANRTSFPEAMDAHFNQDKTTWRSLLSVPPNVLVVDIGAENNSSACLSVMKLILTEREWTFGYTLLTSDVTLSHMAGEKRYAQDFVKMLSSSRFKEVILK